MQETLLLALHLPKSRKHWSCCDWRKCMSQDEGTLNSEEIKAVATCIAIIKLHLSEGISKGVSE